MLFLDCFDIFKIMKEMKICQFRNQLPVEDVLEDAFDIELNLWKVIYEVKLLIFSLS